MEPNSITAAVAVRLKTISSSVNQRVEDLLVEREVDKKTNLLLKAIDRLTELEREGYKIKPDIVAYNDDGTVASASWSKAKLDEKKKHEEQLEKQRNAVDKALAGDYSKLGDK